MAIVQRGDIGGPGGTVWRFEHVPTSLTGYTLPNGELSGLKFIAGTNELTIGTGGTEHTFDFAGQTLSEFSVSLGTEPGYGTELVIGIEIKTAGGTTFTAGQMVSGSTFSVHMRTGSTLAGFAGKYGDRIDSIGLLCETNRVQVGVSLEVGATPPVTVDTTGTVDFMQGDAMVWAAAPGSQTFTFDRLAFFTDQAEQDLIGNWTAAEGQTSEPGFLYQFVSPSTSALEIKENTGPDANTPYWYAIWVKDSNNQLHKLDPEVLNFKKRNV